MNEDVMKYFEGGRSPRLDIKMLPRDKNQVTGLMRRVLCNSFNYCKQYPRKMEVYISILKFVTNYALAYKHFTDERKQVSEADMKAAEEEVKSE